MQVIRHERHCRGMAFFNVSTAQHFDLALGVRDGDGAIGTFLDDDPGAHLTITGRDNPGDELWCDLLAR